MKWMLSVLALSMLAGCGADGPPIRPIKNENVSKDDSRADWISGRVSVHAGAAL
ncbi:MAG: argininosuccinate lyase [Pseudomonadota bacterium]|uniref:argininosuccinate lyase n=1 Tax=Roseovarius TaxID=74030 RepID=UPI0022A678C4|nr:argininosuccinate lyase [Roseovarius sp. EGI FJ00037]MCZ0811487.1 argininosuccinate lyase [Roseovarius sp. EGI FJ00037]